MCSELMYLNLIWYLDLQKRKKAVNYDFSPLEQTLYSCWMLMCADCCVVGVKFKKLLIREVQVIDS